MKIINLIVMAMFFLVAPIFASSGDIKLAAPDKKGGKTIMATLNTRKSDRNFSSKNLSPQQLSNLLWAGAGVSREDGRRTAPSARNWQEIDIYVVMASGTYCYDSKTHSLLLKSKEDLRKHAVRQDFAQKAPIVLVYVANYDKMNGADEEGQKYLSRVDTGFIGQNIYLYCASEGLSTVFIAMVDTKGMGKVLKLKPTQEVLFSQPVGFPNK